MLDAESGRILASNVRATEMLGYSRGELLQLSAADIECSDGPRIIRDFHEDAKQGVVAVEGVHRRKDGSTLPVEIRLTSLALTPPRRILSIVRDTSERKRLEQDRAEEARRKDEFVAFMGHELRNPLAAIDMATEVLSRSPTPTERARMEEIIGRQVTVMRRLVDDLLELERITHGHIDLNLDQLDLAECLRRAAAAMRSTVEGRRQELRLRLPSESVRFLADSIRLDQIVVNRLANASRYTAPGGRIELSGVEDGSEVVIRCKDNGQGVSPEYHRKIFEPFSRGPKTELGYGEASVGLGLALVKQLTELHGGTISVGSGGPGLGSEFTVRLPMVALSAAQGTADAGKPARPSRRAQSVVIVEDNPSVGATLRAALEQSGYSVQLFADAPSALAGLAVVKPDALLIDIGMPGMDGYDLAARLKQQANMKEALCVASSGFKPREYVDVGDPFDRYFNKPVDLNGLLALLEEH